MRTIYDSFPSSLHDRTVRISTRNKTKSYSLGPFQFWVGGAMDEYPAIVLARVIALFRPLIVIPTAAASPGDIAGIGIRVGRKNAVSQSLSVFRSDTACAERDGSMAWLSSFLWTANRMGPAFLQGEDAFLCPLKVSIGSTAWGMQFRRRWYVRPWWMYGNSAVATLTPVLSLKKCFICSTTPKRMCA